MTTRNISQLLNVIAPCSVTRFKDAALEYICLQLESMLENNLIDDLDEDLLLELDEVVRSNQLNCLPFVKSGRAELLLHEHHPSLAVDIDEERQCRVRDMTFRANLKDDDSRLSSSFRVRVDSLDDFISGSPGQEKVRTKSRAARNAPFSPSIGPKDSTIDLMFDMDDDVPFAPGSPKSPTLGLTSGPRTGSSIPKAILDDVDPDFILDEQHSVPKTLTCSGISDGGETPSPATAKKTWSSPALSSTKLDMREIMAQASSTRISNLSMSLSAQKLKDEKAKDETIKAAVPKLSQKERKKQQQQALQQAMSQNADDKPSSPWRIAAAGPKMSLKDVLNEPKTSPLALPTKPLGSPIPSKPLVQRRTGSPDTRFAGQLRSISSNNNLVKTTTQSPSVGPSRTSYQPQSSKSSPLVPHSKSYSAPATKAEPSLQLSLADIIGQQKREQEVIKEAVAKRSLQEIQEEQAFQEWWDQESRRAQEEEIQKAKGPAPGFGRGGKSGGGRSKGGRGRGGRGHGETSKGGQEGGQGKGTLAR